MHYDFVVFLEVLKTRLLYITGYFVWNIKQRLLFLANYVCHTSNRSTHW